MTTRRAQFIGGLQAISPILLGVIPFATFSGVAAVEVGLTPGHAVGMSLIMYAGAAQLAALQLIGAGAPLLITMLTAVIINLRFALYSFSMAPHLKNLPGRWKNLLAYLLSDQAYSVAITRFEDQPQLPHKHWFFLGATSAVWVTWQLGTIAGVVLGAQVPESWSLDFAIPLTFLAVLVPTLKSWDAGAAALGASVLVVAGSGLPFNLGLILAVLGGIAAGTAVGEWKMRRGANQ